MMSMDLIKINDSKNWEFEFLIFKTKTKLLQNFNEINIGIFHITSLASYHLFPILALLCQNIFGFKSSVLSSTLLRLFIRRLSREKWDSALYSRTTRSIRIFSKQVCSVFQDEAIERRMRSLGQFNDKRYRFS